MTKRFLLPAAFVLGFSGAVMAQPDDAPPSTPTDLAANVYSDTAGAIRWSRSSDDRGAVSGYEVTRDGTVLAVRDALSYVDMSLAPGTVYTYGVTALDDAGQRSGTATIRLRTSGGTPPATLAAPKGLRASVYAATAAELFWTRPATFGLRYEVLRDGTRLATTDGTSYFADALAGGETYVYEIVAVDPEGRRSASSGVVAFDLFRDGRCLRRVEGPSAFEDGLRPGTTYRYTVVAVGGPGGLSEPPTTLVLRTRDAPSGDASSDTGAVIADRLVLRIGTQEDGQPTPSRRYVYDDEGFPVREELAYGLPESTFMIDLLSYDSAGRRAERRTFIGSEVGEPEAALRLFVSRYDDRRRWLGEDLRSPPDTPVSARFVHEFDPFDRIVSRETRDLDGTVDFRVAYAYDDAGRLVVQENYDSEGRLVARESFDYIDDEGLLSSSTSIDFEADGNESRRTTYVYLYESGLCDPRRLESVTLHSCVPR